MDSMIYILLYNCHKINFVRFITRKQDCELWCWDVGLALYWLVVNGCSYVSIPNNLTDSSWWIDVTTQLLQYVNTDNRLFILWDS